VVIGIYQGFSDRPGGVPPVDPPDLGLFLLRLLFLLLGGGLVLAGNSWGLVDNLHALEVQVFLDEIVLVGGKLQDGIFQAGELVGDHFLSLPLNVPKGPKGGFEIRQGVGTCRDQQEINPPGVVVLFFFGVGYLGRRSRPFVIVVVIVTTDSASSKGRELSPALDGFLFEGLEGSQHVLQSLDLDTALVGVGNRPEQKGKATEGTAPAADGSRGAPVEIRSAPDDNIGLGIVDDRLALDRIEELSGGNGKKKLVKR
jgi:hypothetical protein